MISNITVDLVVKAPKTLKDLLKLQNDLKAFNGKPYGQSMADFEWFIWYNKSNPTEYHLTRTLSFRFKDYDDAMRFDAKWG